MIEDNFNIFEFLRLIYKKKITIIISIFLFLLLGYFIKANFEKVFNGKLIVSPLTLLDFEEKYTNFYKIDNTSKKENDEISLREISPLTLFYSFLSELQNQKFEKKLKNLTIEWNFLGGQHEIYLYSRNHASKEEIAQELITLLENSNNTLLKKLEKNLLNNINLIDEINKVDNNTKYLEAKKSILIQNLNNIKGMRLTNYNIKGLIIERKILDTNKIIILMGLLGLIVGIIISLTVTYFNNTKSN
tara:strand:- start:271 stop:1008 length:738 start_codon:yes stop_codon:yes gene_type:complete